MSNEALGHIFIVDLGHELERRETALNRAFLKQTSHPPKMGISKLMKPIIASCLKELEDF